MINEPYESGNTDHNVCIAEYISDNFLDLKDKGGGQLSWNYLIHMAYDENPLIQKIAIDAISWVFPHIEDTDAGWNDLMFIVYTDYGAGKGVVDLMSWFFMDLTDIEIAWNDMIAITKDHKDEGIRWRASHVLSCIFEHLEKKDVAFEQLRVFSNDENPYIKRRIVQTMANSFFDHPDKDLLLTDIQQFAKDGNPSVQKCVADAICGIVDTWKKSNIVEKDSLAASNNRYFGAWHIDTPKTRSNDYKCMVKELSGILRQSATMESNISVLNNGCDDEEVMAAEKILEQLSVIKHTKMIWDDLHMRLKHKDAIVRRCAIECTRNIFQQIPDKQSVWNDLIALTEDVNAEVRKGAYLTAFSVFAHVHDRASAWSDLLMGLQRMVYFKSGPARKYEYVLSEVDTTSDREYALTNFIQFVNGEGFAEQQTSRNKVSHIFDRSLFIHDTDIVRDLYPSQADYEGERKAASKIMRLSKVLDRGHRWMESLDVGHADNLWVHVSPQISEAFNFTEDKGTAWNDLISIFNSCKKPAERRQMAAVLCDIHQNLKDKSITQKSITTMLKDRDTYVRMKAMKATG